MKQQTAVEWLVDNLPQRFKNAILISGKEIIEQAKQMEAEKTYETKAYWFGRGILAAREDRISELKPVKQ